MVDYVQNGKGETLEDYALHKISYLCSVHPELSDYTTPNYRDARRVILSDSNNATKVN